LVISMSGRVPMVLAGIGVVAFALAIGLGLGDPSRFFRDYLVAYTLWLGLGLGCLGVALVQFLTGGVWGLLTRRIFEAGAATLPALAVLFVPVLFGLPSVYGWTHADAAAADPTLTLRAVYLNVPFFVARAVGYFIAWNAIALLLARWSSLQDRTADPRVLRRLQRLSIVGLLVLPLTASFAAIDWWMSLEPDWVSTVYPGLVCMSDLLLALAFAVVLIAGLGRRTPLTAVLTPSRLNDLGSLLLAFLMLWAYLMYFQYMLIWAGNLPDEIAWYVRRAEGGWEPLAWTLAGVGFLAPFWLLLFRPLKRSPRWLGSIAALLLVMQVVAVYWLVEPAFAPDGPVLDMLQPLLWVALGGLWLGAFAWRLGNLPLLPPNDPRLAPALEAARATA
jgi:hypothetical protein